MSTLRIEILNKELESLYKKRVNVEGDAGVDLYFPEEVTIPSKALGIIVPLGIKGEMVQVLSNHLTDNIPKEMIKGMFGGVLKDRYMSYMVTPRSSISKTPLRMSNSVGIIDAGYRGEIIAKVDNLSNDDYKIEKGTRLFQICDASLEPIELRIVDKLSETTRGVGGFGSTG